MIEQKTLNPPLARSPDRGQMMVGAGVIVVSLVMAIATWQIDEPAYLEGPGARFVPGMCAAVLAVCGAWLIWEAQHGGWRAMPGAAEESALQYGPWVWVTSGMLLMGLLIAHIGFVLACSLCYVFAMQGLRRTARQAPNLGIYAMLQDAGWGLVLSALVLAIFTRVLGVTLPVFIASGWL